MKTKFIIFLLLFSKVLLAQSGNDKIVYLDSLWKETTKEKHIYYRVVKDYYLEKSEYQFEDYFKSGKIQMEGISETKDYLSEKGSFKYYYENGNIRSEVSFEKGKPKGNQTDWYENGVKKMEGEYVMKDGSVLIREGEAKEQLKINQYWNADNKQEVVDGNGFINDTTKDYSEKGTIHNGWKNGSWEGRHKLYKLSYSETYENGELINGKSIDSLNVEHHYKEIFVKPKPKKGMENFYKYISKKFKFPKGTEGISGRIFLTFVIDKDGDATDINIIESLGEKLDNEAIRLIKGYPDWSSGELRGIKVKVLYSIPIKIVAPQ